MEKQEITLPDIQWDQEGNTYTSLESVDQELIRKANSLIIIESRINSIDVLTILGYKNGVAEYEIAACRGSFFQLILEEYNLTNISLGKFFNIDLNSVLRARTLFKKYSTQGGVDYNKFLQRH